MPDYRRYAALVAVFAAAFYVAVIVFAFGMISLVTETDVIVDRRAGPVVGPAMSGAAALVLLAFLLVIGMGRRPKRQRLTPLAALGIGIVAYLVFIGVGAIMTAIGEDRPFRIVGFVIDLFASPYAITIGVLAFAVVLVYELILVGRFQEKGRPRWPWERDDEP